MSLSNACTLTVRQAFGNATRLSLRRAARNRATGSPDWLLRSLLMARRTTRIGLTSPCDSSHVIREPAMRSLARRNADERLTERSRSRRRPGCTNGQCRRSAPDEAPDLSPPSSRIACRRVWSHNPKVAGSNPAPATKRPGQRPSLTWSCRVRATSCNPEVGDGAAEWPPIGSASLTVMTRQGPPMTVMPTGAGDRPESSSNGPEGCPCHGQPPASQAWCRSTTRDHSRSRIPGGLCSNIDGEYEVVRGRVVVGAVGAVDCADVCVHRVAE